LDLGYRTALSDGDFLVAGCNQAAHGWLQRWPQWPGPASVLTGPQGCGKTHLAHLFSARSGARIVAVGALTVAAVPDLMAPGRALVVEDCDAGPLDQDALFHLINLAKESGGWLLLTARDAPARWSLSLPDLKSRLLAMPVVQVGPPDDALLGAVLVKLFADRQLKVGDGLIPYLLGRMERSFAAALALVDALDKASLAQGRAVTTALARAIL
jgi:chromosomal replication initiation ATPase DnaA